jgi:hypothetical protein
VSLKDWVDAELVRARRREEHVSGFVRPVEGECVGVMEGEILEYVLGIIADKDVSHLWPSGFCEHVSRYLGRRINALLES